MTASDGSSKSRCSGESWEMLAIAPETIDIMLTDINEEGMKKVEDGAGIVYGNNMRLMVPLVCERSIRGSPKVVIFLVDTGSMPSFLSRKTIEALINKEDPFPEFIRLHIQTEDEVVECSLSNPAGHFPDANVLGMKALVHLGLSIEIDKKKMTFQLVQR
uniref:Uncharacterized protein n=1 Tax=Ditylenchus dipsaci TaxID=166011 RepID=A0A915ENA7_9BILA